MREVRDAPLTELLRPLRESFNQLRNSCDGATSSIRVAGKVAGFIEGCAGRVGAGPLVRGAAEVFKGGVGLASDGVAAAGFDLPFGPTVVQAPLNTGTGDYNRFVKPSKNYGYTTYLGVGFGIRAPWS